MDNKEAQKKYAKMIAKAWSDPEFAKRLLKEPEAVLKEAGILMESGANYHFHLNTNSDIHLVLPEKPTGEMSEEQLTALAAGKWFYCGTDYSGT